MVYSLITTHLVYHGYFLRVKRSKKILHWTSNTATCKTENRPESFKKKRKEMEDENISKIDDKQRPKC